MRLLTLLFCINEKRELGDNPNQTFTAAQLPSAGVEDCNPDAHELCASTKDAANFDLVYDRNQPTPVVDSGGDPIMFLGHVPKVDAAMPKCHGMLVALIGKFANEFDRLPRSNLLVDIAAAIDSLRRFAPEFCDPGWIRSHAAFREQRQRVRPPLLSSALGRQRLRPQKERMDCRQGDQGPGNESAGKSVKVPRHH